MNKRETIPRILYRSLFILMLSVGWNCIKSYAQTYQSTETAITNGQAKATSTSFQTTAIIGQPAVSTVSSTSFDLTSGFLPFFLTTKLVDVSITNIVLDPSTVGPGNSLNLSFDIVSNESGNIAANGLEVGIYLSEDMVIDGSEMVKTITVANPIPGSDTYSFPQSGDDYALTIPASTSPGAHYIILSLDPSNLIGETDEANNVLEAAITISDDITKPVIGVVTKDNFYSTGSAASVTVNDDVEVGKVYFYHRGIRANDSDDWGTPVEVPLSSGIYSVTLQAAWLDELGVEYWFEAFDTSNNRDSTRVHYTFYQTVGNELTLPRFSAGRTQNAYQMFSIPFDLTQKNASTVLSKFGAYDPAKWRMYHYLNGSTKEYNNGWTSIDAGRSYWLIHDVADAGQILIGEGRSTQASKENPYVINLIQGWNQIGNPYRFDVSWADIMDFNSNPTTVERFRIWSNGAFSDGSTLSAFGGGFVFTSAPVSLKVPVTANVGGRIAGQESVLNPINNPEWQITFEISNGDLQFNLGGLGMHPDARVGKDYYDDVAMPRLPEYVDINFSHPEYFISRFNKDIVPTSEENAWYFTINKNSGASKTTLSWDNTYFGENDRAIYLIDLERTVLIDMRETSTYSFNMEDNYGFKVVYGKEYTIESKLIPEEVVLGQNYPNPFSIKTVIPIALPETASQYNVNLVVLNTLGQLVTTLVSSEMEPGYHLIEWDRESNNQESETGFYIIKLQVNTGTEIVNQTKHMIIY